jgi:hypothetical protein
MRFALMANWLAFMVMAALVSYFRYKIARAEQTADDRAAAQSLQAVEVR